ncbi:hypothetical protein MNV49_004461 [Pseudohyphozyma bogoriensis]|nr:hypothetical protein MNV49_004461 [Pseudohyphozyma bogoriensis]
MYSRTLRLASSARVVAATATPTTRGFAATSLRSKTIVDSVKDAAQTVNKAAGAAALKGIETGEDLAAKAKPLADKAKSLTGDASEKAEELKSAAGEKVEEGKAFAGVKAEESKKKLGDAKTEAEKKAEDAGVAGAQFKAEAVKAGKDIKRDAEKAFQLCRETMAKSTTPGAHGPSGSTLALIAFLVLAIFYLFHSHPDFSRPVLNTKSATGGAKKKPAGAAVVQQAQSPLNLDSPADELSVWQRRIVAVGDIHGDLSHLTKILRMAHLIDLKGLWIGGDTILVQTGDIVDRGKDTIALYRFMDGLRPQAEKAGGGVVSLLGNHEIMNALGDWRYVTKEDIATFGGEKARRAAMTEGWIGQTWRTNYSITARIPYAHNFPSLPSSLLPTLPSTPLGSSSQSFLSDPTPPTPHPTYGDPFSHAAASFVHGGIQPGYLKGLKTETPIRRINEIGRGLLESLVRKPTTMQLPRDATPEQREFWSERGPMWDRLYALDEDDEEVCANAAEACKILGVRRLVMGHTPNFEGMVSRCDGKIILIDTGISRAYGGALSALEIVVTLTPYVPVATIPEDWDDGFDADRESLRKRAVGKGEGGEETSKWVEKEVVSAVYVGNRPRETLARSERIVELPV